MRFLAAILPQHPQRNPRLQRASRASVVFLLVPPSESRSPPALITVRIERASHRSSSSELLIFPLRSRARILGLISRGENDAYVVIRRNCRRGYRKLTTSRPPVNGELGELRGSRTVSSGWDRPIKSRVGKKWRYSRPSNSFFHISRIIENRNRTFLSSCCPADVEIRSSHYANRGIGERESARFGDSLPGERTTRGFLPFPVKYSRRIMAARTYTSQCDF